MLSRFALAMLIVSAPALAQDPGPAPAQVEMTTPAFEFFRLAPGKTEAFMRSVAIWDQVSLAGGQPPSQVFLHSGGEGWDVLLYKVARPKPTAAQNAAMEAKRKELGLPTGALYFITIREKMADHMHFDATGPMTAAQWVAELDRQRAEMKARK